MYLSQQGPQHLRETGREVFCYIRLGKVPVGEVGSEDEYHWRKCCSYSVLPPQPSSPSGSQGKTGFSFPTADASKRELPSITRPYTADRKRRQLLGEERLDSLGEEVVWWQKTTTKNTERAAMKVFMVLLGGGEL